MQIILCSRRRNRPVIKYFSSCTTTLVIRGARWLSGRVSDSGARGPGFLDLPPPCCVLEQDTLLPESTG